MLKGKKIFSILLAVMVCVAMMPAAVFADEVTGVEINNTNFPDAQFCKYVKKFDTNKDKVLSAAEIQKATKIRVAGEDIKDMTGIEYFTSMTTLDCQFVDDLAKLDLSKNTKLKELIGAGTKVKTLDLSKNTKLTSIYWTQGVLKELDLRNNKNLTSVTVGDNKVAKLVLPKSSKLKKLYCYNNRLTKLNVSKNPKLTELLVEYNKLKTLSVSKNKNLKVLEADHNKALKKLSVSKCKKLKRLMVDNTKISKVNVKNLKKLNCLGVTKTKIKKVNVKNCSKKIEVYASKKTKVTGKKLKKQNFGAGVYLWSKKKIMAQ